MAVVTETKPKTKRAKAAGQEPPEPPAKIAPAVSPEPENPEGTAAKVPGSPPASSGEIVLQNITMTVGDATLGVYDSAGGERVLSIKNGQLSLPMDSEGERIRDQLLASSEWRDLTSYPAARRVANPEPAPPDNREVDHWKFYHPDASAETPINGTISLRGPDGPDGSPSSISLQVENNVITVRERETAELIQKIHHWPEIEVVYKDRQKATAKG